MCPSEIDPSDSSESYWLARTVWALGDGNAAFAADGPGSAPFAQFLLDRLHLAVTALERESLSRYGQRVRSDGVDLAEGAGLVFLAFMNDPGACVRTQGRLGEMDGLIGATTTDGSGGFFVPGD